MIISIIITEIDDQHGYHQPKDFNYNLHNNHNDDRYDDYQPSHGLIIIMLLAMMN